MIGLELTELDLIGLELIELELIELELIGLEVIELEPSDFADQDKACGWSDTQLTLTEVLAEGWLRHSCSWMVTSKRSECWLNRLDGCSRWVEQQDDNRPTM